MALVCLGAIACGTSKSGDGGQAGSTGSVPDSGQSGASGDASLPIDPDACAALTDDCNNDKSDGCETVLTTRKNCGACGNVCPGVLGCFNGQCGLGDAKTCTDDQGAICTDEGTGCEFYGRNGCRPCPEGTYNCDGDPSNGCEVLEKERCGSCAKVCEPDHTCFDFEPDINASRCVEIHTPGG